MSQKESGFLSMLVTLVLVTGLSALSLGFIYRWTEGPIANAQKEKKVKAIRAVVGEYDNDPVAEAYEVCQQAGGQKHRHRYQRRKNCRHQHENDEADLMTFYPARVDQEVGVTAITAYSENGYSGRIELMVGIDKEGVIRNIRVISHKETPGLGSKIKDEKFINQFIGKKLSGFDFKVKKDGGQVDAISGATISSRAFSEAVQQALEAYKQTSDEQKN